MVSIVEASGIEEDELKGRIIWLSVNNNHKCKNNESNMFVYLNINIVEANFHIVGFLCARDSFNTSLWNKYSNRMPAMSSISALIMPCEQ